jgi:RNA polymerase-binding transcription factor DksA
MKNMTDISEKETLDFIRITLEDIKAILTLTNQDKLEEMKRKLLKPGSRENQVYDLCDGTMTQDIANKTQKSSDYTNSVISTLRRKGLIRTIERDGKKIHEQRF